MIRVPLRFIGFFAFGLTLFLLYMGLMMVVVFEGIFPWLGLSADHSGLFLTVFFAILLSGGALFALLLAKPIWLILKLIQRLRQGQYELHSLLNQFYSKKGELKLMYRLYKEVISDLTRLSEILKQTEIKQKQLETDKQQWIRGVSHDLKTPLSYIVGYSSLLVEPTYQWSDGERTQFTREIFNKSQYIEQLLRDFNRTFDGQDKESETNMLEAASFSLAEFLQQLVTDASSYPQAKACSIELDEGEKNTMMYGDRRLLYRAFINLLLNAAQHNPPQTTIQITINQLDQEQVIIVISDNGLGIPAEVLERLHLPDPPFSSGNPNEPRSGMGLIIAKNLIQAHGGTLSFQNPIKKGTAAHISIPLKPKPGINQPLERLIKA